MKRSCIHILLVVILMTVSGAAANAQKYPERKNIRSGNRQYEQGNYSESEVDYLRALAKNPDNYEAAFNLANAMYKQERYDESAQIFQRLAQDTTRGGHAAKCHYNAGNALFQQRNLKEALEEYKSSLRVNPGDMDAKFNLAYVKKLLEDEEQNGGGGDNDQDQNQDQNQDNQDNQQGEGERQDQDKGDGDNQQNKDDQEDKKENKNDQGKNDDKPRGQSQEQGMSRTEAQQLLDAMQAQEDKTQEKIDEQKKAAAVKEQSRRNW